MRQELHVTPVAIVCGYLMLYLSQNEVHGLGAGLLQH